MTRRREMGGIYVPCGRRPMVPTSIHFLLYLPSSVGSILFRGCEVLIARSVPRRDENVSFLQVVDVALFPRCDCRGEVMI
jgi:hypothetical protein